MNINTISYWIAEAVASIVKNQKIFWSGVAIITVVLFLISIFYVAFGLSNSLIEMVGETYGKIEVFLEDLNQEQTNNVERILWSIDGVKNVEYISKEEARIRAIERIPAGMLTGIEDDFYPPSFIVSIEDLMNASQIAFKIRGIEGVGEQEEDVSMMNNIDKLAKGAATVEVLAITVFIIATASSCFIMTNSIKLMLHSRRKEISIMKYVGATDLFTKAPFVIEGIAISLFGASIALILTWFVCGLLENLATLSIILSFMSEAKELIPSLSIFLIVLSIGVGAIGSSISINKYLDV